MPFSGADVYSTKNIEAKLIIFKTRKSSRVCLCVCLRVCLWGSKNFFLKNLPKKKILKKIPCVGGNFEGRIVHKYIYFFAYSRRAEACALFPTAVTLFLFTNTFTPRIRTSLETTCDQKRTLTHAQ